MSRVAYVDCPSGVAGDMLLAALLDVGVPQALFAEVIERLGLKGVRIEARPVQVSGFRALRVDVTDEAPARDHSHLSDILARIAASGLPAPVCEQATRTFRLLAAAEARVHGSTEEEVHFHEVGAADALVDIVGAAAGMHHLGVARLIASPLPMGTGTVRCAHGELPLPAPAVAEMLPGVPVYGTTARGETVTPTGLAILQATVERWGPMPPMTVRTLGCGAGHRDMGLPGPLRLFVGEGSPATELRVEEDILVETNIDDMNPQFFEGLYARLFEAGANDVWLTPILMKKGRPAHGLSVLAPAKALEAITRTLFRHSSTIGTRVQPVTKRSLPRETIEVNTPWGSIPVKRSRLGDELLRVSPEHDAVRERARQAGVAEEKVWQAAWRAAQDAESA